MSGPTDPYDALAADYRRYAEGRSCYLHAVDAFVLESVGKPSPRVLDVGAGDGHRGSALATAMGASSLTLVEPSAQMAERCRAIEGAEVWHGTVDGLTGRSGGFDVALCLWNVLGHIPDAGQRVDTLAAVRSLLVPNGVLLLDVNNRHNAASYGWSKAIWRCVVDALAFDPARGDAEYDWVIAGRTYKGRGHLFVPAEVEALFGRAGFDVVRRIVVDYKTGQRRRTRFGGQLCYLLRPGDR